MVIAVKVKPISGRRDRICLSCGDNYNGWNMYVCHACELDKSYTIMELWAL